MISDGPPVQSLRSCTGLFLMVDIQVQFYAVNLGVQTIIVLVEFYAVNLGVQTVIVLVESYAFSLGVQVLQSLMPFEPLAILR